MLDITLLNYKELFDKLEADYGQGDWEVATSDGGDNSRHIVREKKGKKRIICHVEDNERQDGRANAQLICSTPDLLFAIRLAIEELELLYTHMGTGDQDFLKEVQQGKIALEDSPAYGHLCNALEKASTVET